MRHPARKSKPKATSSTGTLDLITTEPADFFRQQLGKALSNQKVKADPSTEHYLVDLLLRFMISDNLYAVGEDGSKHEEVLALLMSDAVNAPDIVLRTRGFQRVGDISLYTAGFFADSLARKIVDVDYYIGMGRTAYGTLASMGHSQRVYNELAQKFAKFVDILGEVSSTTGTNDPKNILRLYELWLKTRSERAERTLKEAGIIPNKNLKGDWRQ